MKRALAFLVVFVMPCLVLGQERKFPVVQRFGGIFPVEQAAPVPDPSMEYKVVMEVSMPSEKPDEVNFGLNAVARLVNLHAEAGIPVNRLKVVVAVHGEAAYCLTDHAAYRARFKTDNPNLEMLTELRARGVELYVCGQSLVARKIDRKTLAPEVQVALSALTTLTTCQLKGYAFLKF